MHRYFPHTAEDEAQMLGVVGADRVEDLFASIPADCRHEGALPLTAMTEWELTAQAEALAASMPAAGSAWIGAGSLNSRRSSPVCSAWKWPMPPCTTARPRWPKVR